MFARVTMLESQPGQFDAVVMLYRETIVPFITAQDGCRGIHLMIDRQHGQVVTVSLWESEEALRASEEMAAQMRTQARIAGTSPERVDRYEVVD
jgi:heme-degrading monooxygenase HmoA